MLAGSTGKHIAMAGRLGSGPALGPENQAAAEPESAVMRTLVWLLRALLFFTLFAFALNNSHETVVRWFFGYEWRAPQVIVVLLAFGLGAAFGVLAMVPAWWRHRRAAQRAEPLPGAPAPASDTTGLPPYAAHQDGV